MSSPLPPAGAPRNRRDLWLRLAGGLAFGLAIWLALPARVIALDDDFGYLLSVVETYRAGRPVTYDWLAPWAATSSGLAALAFAVTGKFQLAVHGLLAASGGLAFFGAMSFARRAGLGTGLSAGMALTALGGPTTMFMLLMFTSVPFYWGCLWVAAWLALTRRWGWFLLVFCLALGARQSAATWLALPAWALLSTWWERRRGGMPPWPWKALAAIVAGLAWLVLVKSSMNRTYGQDVVFTAMGKAFGAGRLPAETEALAIAGLLLAAGFGLGCLGHGLARLWRGEWRWRGWSAAVMWRLGLSLAAGTAGALVPRWTLAHVEWSHGCYLDIWGPAACSATGALAGFALAAFSRLPSWGFLLTAGGCWGLTTLYGGLFDYYFADIFFWGFAAALAGREWPVPTGELSRSPLPFLLAGRGAVVLLGLLTLAWDFRCYVRHKLAQDRIAAFIAMTEPAIREGRIRPHEMGFAPFGYLGWHLERHYILHDGRDARKLAGFMAYRDDWNGERGTGTLAEYPKSFRAWKDWLPAHNNKALRESKTAETVAEIEAPILWFWKARFQLKRVAPPEPREDRLPLNYDGFVPRYFPLNDAEWAELMRTGHVEARDAPRP